MWIRIPLMKSLLRSSTGSKSYSTIVIMKKENSSFKPIIIRPATVTSDKHVSTENRYTTSVFPMPTLVKEDYWNYGWGLNRQKNGEFPLKNAVLDQ